VRSNAARVQGGSFLKRITNIKAKTPMLNFFAAFCAAIERIKIRAKKYLIRVQGFEENNL
jgi:hypothetical protein